MNHIELVGSVTRALGVRILETKHLLEIYLPDATKDGDPVFDHGRWVQLIADAATRMAGGCSILPTAVGQWVNSDGVTIQEATTVVRVYVTQAQLLAGGLALRTRLAQYRRECEQEVVLMTLNGQWLELAAHDGQVRGYASDE